MLIQTRGTLRAKIFGAKEKGAPRSDSRGAFAEGVAPKDAGSLATQYASD
jgi:hypothetical protein